MKTWEKEVQALEREAEALEAQAAAKRKRALDLHFRFGLPHTPQEVAAAEQWNEDVEAFAGDGAAIIDRDGNIVGRVAAVDGVVDLRGPRGFRPRQS